MDFNIPFERDQYPILGWEGKFFWHAPNSSTIFPLVKSIDDIEDVFLTFSTPAKMFFPEENTNMDFCKFLMVGFWPKKLVNQLVHKYMERTTLEDGAKLWHPAVFSLDESDIKDKVMTWIESGFDAIVTDCISNQSFILSYDNEKKLIRGFIPSNSFEFISKTFDHIHDFFVVNYDLYLHEELTDELVEQATKKADLVQKNMIKRQILREIREAAHSPDKLKTNRLLALFGRCSNFKERIAIYE